MLLTLSRQIASGRNATRDQHYRSKYDNEEEGMGSDCINVIERHSLT